MDEGIGPLQGISKVGERRMPAGPQGIQGLAGPAAWTDVVLGGDISTTSGTLVDATGLSFSAAANTKYLIQVDVLWTGGILLGGIGLSLNGPASPNFVLFDWCTYTGATARVDRMGRDWNAGSTAVGLIGDTGLPIIARMGAYVSNGANAGTVIVRYLVGGILNTATILAGSTLRYRVLV